MESPVLESPYKGLASFGDSELDALLFFGRERETETIAVNVLASRLTVVYGPSGVGKSSVVRAGVAQRLRAQDCGAVVVHDAWAEHPADSLVESVRGECPGLGPALGLVDTVAAAAHARGEVHLLLDQFEEYFLYHGTSGPLADELPALLRRPGLRVSVLIALRDDAVAGLDAFTGRLPEMFENLIRLDRLDRAAGRDAIVRPLERYGELTGTTLRAEPELVEAVLDEVAQGRVDFSGAGDVTHDRDRIETPFLQLVLERLWAEEQRHGSSLLRRSTLDALGGAESIVRAHVFGSLEQLPPDERGTAARIVRQLVTPSGAKISHAADDLAAYADVEPGDLRSTLETLLRERIVRGVNGRDGSETRYEIFHDVLAAPVLAWRQAYELERERERARRQRRRLLALVGAAAAALVVLAAIAAYALTQRSHAQAQARDAHGRELAAQALAAVPTDPAASVALALRAAALEPDAQAESVLRTSLLALRERHVVRLGGRLVAATFSPDGGLLLAASSNGKVGVYDADGRRLVALPAQGALTRAAWRPDGRAFALGAADGTATLWSIDGTRLRIVRTRSPITALAFVGRTLLVGSGLKIRLVDGRATRTIPVPAGIVAAALSPDRKTVAIAVRRKHVLTARLVDVATRRVRATLAEHGVDAVAFSPSGRLLATGSTDRTARLWHVATGKLVATLPHRGYVVAVRFSPDGTQLVTASTDGTAGVWDVATGTRRLLLTGATGAAEDAAFAPDGSEIAVAFADSVARLYSSLDGRLLAPLAGHSDAVTGIDFDAQGRLLATASDDGSARIWDANAGDQLVPVDRRRSAVQAAFAGARGLVVTAARREVRVVRPDGRVVRTAGTASDVRSVTTAGGDAAVVEADGDVVLVSATSVRTLRGLDATAAAPVPGAAPVTGTATGLLRVGSRRVQLGSAVVAIRAAPARVVALTRDGRVHVLTPTGLRVATIRAHAQVVALSADGATVATAHAREAELWDATTGARIARLAGHASLVDDVEFSPASDRVVTASVDHTARIWDARTGRLLHVLRGHFFPVRTASFSPDGRWVVTASQFTAGLWNAASGELVLYLRGNTKPLTTATFGPDSLILTAGEDGTARVVRCDICRDLPGLERVARTRLEAVGR